MILTACGNGTASGDNPQSPGSAEVPFMIPTVEDAARPASTADLNLQQQLFMQDLDYMLEVLENNFALFDAAFWIHGMDIRRSIATLQRQVADNPGMDEDDFFAALRREMSEHGAVGDLRIIEPFLHRQNRNVRDFDMFRYEHVLNFYEPRYSDGPHDDWARADIILGLGEGAFLGFIERAALMGAYEVVEDIIAAREIGDFDTARDFIVYALGITAGTPTIQTDIIDDGRIAYMAIYGGGAMGVANQRKLEFYEEIQGFDHLIIDLRGNPSPFWENFRQGVFRPLMTPNERHSVSGFGFTPVGDRHLESVLEDTRNGRMFVTSNFTPGGELLSVSEIIDNFDLPELMAEDMERMDYAFNVHFTTITPRTDDEPAFDGKIWLLTGANTSAGANKAAFFSKELDFATIVGETSRGGWLGPRVWVALPNTGIMFSFDTYYITDSRGRPLEAGVIPHHFNMEGMDALETALALINQGEY